MNKLFEVKGVRGLRKLMKEIAQTASTGKHDNELIGRTSIPLKVGRNSAVKSVPLVTPGLSLVHSQFQLRAC